MTVAIADLNLTIPLPVEELTAEASAQQLVLIENFILLQDYLIEAAADLLVALAVLQASLAALQVVVDAQKLPALSVGDLDCPLAFIPAKNSLNIVIGVGTSTFARTVAADYQDRYKAVKNAAINTARYGRSGILLEGVSENVLLYSDQFDNAAWNKANAGTGILPVVTADAGVAPDGATTADRVVLNKGAGTTTGDYSYIEQIKTGLSTPHESTRSVWIKSYDGVSTYDVALRNSFANYQIKTITGDWQRIELINSSVASTSDSLQLILRGTYGTADVADLLCWRGQTEEKLYSTSPIKTVAIAVTRTADSWTIPTTENYPNPDDGLTILFDYTPLADGEDLPLRMLGSVDSGGSSYELRVASVPSVFGYVVASGGGGYFSIAIGAVVKGEKARWGFQLANVGSNVEWAIYKAGLLVGSGSVAGFAGVPDGTLDIGSWNGVVADGYYANLRLFPSVLSANMMRVA